MSDINIGVVGIQKIFQDLPSKYLLMNGNIEKNLKFFVGMVLEGESSDFSYVMDKKINDHEIDMLGFERGSAKIASEFKCTFATDRGATVKAAKDACLKILKTKSIDSLSSSQKTIVHFLNNSDARSSTSLNPTYIKDKFPDGKPITSLELIEIFKNELGSNAEDIKNYEYEFDNDALNLEAIVVKIA